MIDIQAYTEKLKSMGYSQDDANAIIALHLSTGTIEMLEYSITENGVKFIRKNIKETV